MALFRNPNIKNILRREVIPFYDRNIVAEEAIMDFLTCPPPESKATIMTLFEPPGTGKTTILQNMPILYKEVYRISVPSSHIIIGRGTDDSAFVEPWFKIFAKAEASIRQLSDQNKSVSLDSVGKVESNQDSSWPQLSRLVTERLGEQAIVFLHIDEFQIVTSKKLLQALYSLRPCSDNVKMILSGTTALGNDKIQGMREFNSIACPPLDSFGCERVHVLLKNVLYWEELQIKYKSESDSKKIKTEIEQALQGVPKSTLYFLQALYNSDASLEMTEEEVNGILERAYVKYREKQQKMLAQLLDIGNEYSNHEETNLFEKIVIIFSYPEDFGLERSGNSLIGTPDNEIIQLLLPFNRSGLVRIYKKSDSVVSLAIPDNFTIRYIQEHTLYFPKNWLQVFNSTCDVASTVSENVKGYSVQVWLSVLLLNQHSILCNKIQELVRERQGLEIYDIYYETNTTKNTFSTFMGLPEDINITGPAIAYDGRRNACVDLVIPYLVKNLHKTGYDTKFLPLFFQITCRKDGIAAKAKDFFERITRAANSKSNNVKNNLYTSCIAIFITVHPLEVKGNMAKSVKNYLERNDDLILLDLSKEEVFSNLDLEITTSDIKYLQEWIKKSETFVNNINSGSPSLPIRSEHWKSKSLSPYGNPTKKQKLSNTPFESKMHSQGLNMEDETSCPYQEFEVIQRKKTTHEVNIGSSVSTQKLCRSSGSVVFGDMSLDKSKPKTWKSDQILILLQDTDEGVGLSKKRLGNVEYLEGADFENIVDALLSFEGAKETRIDYATQRLDKNVKHNATSESIVRWVFQNLLEYKNGKNGKIH